MHTSAYPVATSPSILLSNRRRFFTLCFLFNLIVLLCAASGAWRYPRDYAGAWVLGNLLVAILVRTELFGRILYAVLIAMFAKVRILSRIPHITDIRLVVPALVPVEHILYTATLGRDSFRMRVGRSDMAHLPGHARI